MENTLLVGLSGLVALRQELDTIANNVANIDTTGFKTNGSLFAEYLSSDATSQQGDPVSFVTDQGTWTDMTEGPIQHTGNPLDVAIDGDAFFAVQTPDGVRYTRDGAFKLNASGEIVDNAGDPILGDSGPITLQQNDNEISISPDGTISVREGDSNTDSERGKLRLVSFADPTQLQKDGGNNFVALDGAQPQPSTTSSVAQGALEKSNVRAVLQIARMIEVTRSYSQVAAIMQQQGNLDLSAIDKLAEVPA